MGIVLLTSIICTTIVYSAYNTKLQINGDAILRSVNDIRITSIDLSEYSNGVVEDYNSRYSKDTTSMYVTIPSNGNVIYDVKITNKSSLQYVFESYDLSNSNSNVKLELLDINNEEIIDKNSIKTFKIKLSNKTASVQTTAVTVNYVFEQYRVYTLNYDLNGGILEKDNPSTYTKYSDTFKLNNPTREGYEFLGWVEGNNSAVKDFTITKGTIGDKSLKASWKDVTAPILTLAKITEKEIPFDTTWSLSGGATIDDGVLTIPEGGRANSDYIDVGGAPWYITFEAYSDIVSSKRYSSSAACRYNQYYYDSDKNAVANVNGSNYNGVSMSFPLSEWTFLNRNLLTPFKFYKAYWSSDIKYVKFRFYDDNDYSSVPVKYRNIILHVQVVDNSYYDIYLEYSDNEGVTVKKYAKGNQTKDYFKTNGTNITDTYFRVIENGIYTVYVADKAGNSTIQTIEITNIK